MTCSAAGSTDGTWAGVAARLDPGPAVTGLVLADGTTTVQGRAAGTLPITATATAVVEGTAGLRHTLTAAPVPLDGQVTPAGLERTGRRGCGWWRSRCTWTRAAPGRTRSPRRTWRSP